MTPPEKTMVDYKIDPKESLFTVQALASITHSPKFAIRDLSGVATFTPGSLQKASLKVTIASSSLELQDESAVWQHVWRSACWRSEPGVQRVLHLPAGAHRMALICVRHLGEISQLLPTVR
jgi:hypothetical protein